MNIALMNELSQVFSRLDIDTNEVIDAALSKWNFLAFRPGLVGGHCISVDPYYLSHKAGTNGFISDVILSAREIDDSMASSITAQVRLARRYTNSPSAAICRQLVDRPSTNFDACIALRPRSASVLPHPAPRWPCMPGRSRRRPQWP